MALATLGAIIGYLQSQTVWIGKEGGEVIRRVLLVVLNVTDNNLRRLQHLYRLAHFCLANDTKAEMVQAGGIGIVRLL